MDAPQAIVPPRRRRMTERQIIVVDTNVFVSALLSPDSAFARVILTSTDVDFYICESTLVELFEHKERLAQTSRLALTDLLVVYHSLLRAVTVYKEASIASHHRSRASDLCRYVDAEDTPHVALTLQLDALLWTGDRRLKAGLRRQGFDRFFEP